MFGHAVLFWTTTSGTPPSQLTLTGALSSAGTAVASWMDVPVAATLTTSGTASIAVSVSMAGTASPSGTTAVSPWVSLAGSLTSAGSAVVSSVATALVGAVSATGTVVTPAVATIVSGILSTAGSVGFQAQIRLSGALSAAGNAFMAFALALVGALSATGSLTISSVNALLTGALSAAGQLGSLVAVRITGALTSVGSIGHQVQIRLSGALSAAGSTFMAFALALAGALSMTGSLTIPSVRIIVTGALSWAGQLGSLVSVRLAGVLSSAGSAAGLILKAVPRIRAATTRLLDGLFRTQALFGSQSTRFLVARAWTARIWRESLTWLSRVLSELLGMALDQHKNFARSTVSVAPSPPTTGTTLTVADPSFFPAVPFFNCTIWPANAPYPLPTNAEIVRVVAVTAGVFTIERAQEGTTARAIQVGDQIEAGITAKTITDLEAGRMSFAGQQALDFLYASAPDQLARMAAVPRKGPRLNAAGTAWEMVESVVFQSNGFVGIGTDTPTAKLDVTTNNLSGTPTNDSGLSLVNTTPATNGVEQISPSLRWRGSAWKSDAPAESQVVDFRVFARPVQGTSTVDAYLAFQASVNNGAYSTPLAIRSTGKIGIGTVEPESTLEVWVPNIGTSPTYGTGVSLINPTAASSGAPQYSPALRLQGQAWKSDAPASSQTVDFRLITIPVQGTSVAEGYLSIQSAVAGSAFTERMVIRSTGRVGIGTSLPGSTLDIRVDNMGISAAYDAGLTLSNRTSASSGSQQNSPGLWFQGEGWKTDPPAGSQSVHFRLGVFPTQGTAAPGGYLGFTSAIAGGLGTIRMVITTDGNIGIGTTSPASKLHIEGQTGWIIQDEQDSNPTTAHLDANDAIAIYSKNNTFVIAYNNAGTITYLKIPLDGSTTTWTHNTTAP